jgi:hypothetical protein
MIILRFFLSLFLLVFYGLVFGQQILKTKQSGLLAQERDVLFSLNEQSYQNLTLYVDLTNIRYSNRSTFVSITTEIQQQTAEIGRFYLPEYPSDATSHYEDISNTANYTFDICLWQKVLSETGSLKFYTDGSFDDFEMDVYFLEEKGQPSVLVNEIISLWYSGKNGFLYEKEGIDPELIPPKSIELKNPSQKAIVQILAHGVAKSNKPDSRFYFFNINGKEVAKRSVWRDDCSYNPVYPQSGKWYQNRPNWCPGATVVPINHIIERKELQNEKLEIDLRFQKDIFQNSGIHSYIFSGVLFLIDKPKKAVNAAITKIISPNSNKKYQRYNPICSYPIIIIKNLGYEPLETLILNYGYNYQVDNKYRWTGELEFLEEEIVYLPPLNWYFYEKDDEPQSFTAIISRANGKEDAFARGKMTTEMDLAVVYPYRLSFLLRTDSNAIDNVLEILDDNGTPYFMSEDLKADSTYVFHVNFIPGCYEMILFDQIGDGILERNNKKYVLEILDQRKGTLLKAYDGNFGSEIREQFMIFR